jgi:hypothetical protein
METPRKNNLKLYDIRMKYEAKEEWTWVKVSAKTPFDIDCLPLANDHFDTSRIELQEHMTRPHSPMSFVIVINP